MAVSVESPALTAAWATVGARESVIVLLRTLEPIGPERLARMSELTAQVNVDLESQFVDADNQPTWGHSPVAVADGTVWHVDCQHPDGPGLWLDALADRLGASGVSGSLLPYRFPDFANMDQLMSHEKPGSASLVLAMNRWEPYGKSAMLPPWKADPGLQPALVDLAFAHFGDQPGRLEMGHGTLSEPPRAELRRLLLEALSAPPLDVPLVWVRRFGVEDNRSIGLDILGHVVLTVVSPPELTVERSREMTGLALPWSSACDWIALVEGGIGEMFADAYRYSRGRRLPRYYNWRRDLDTTRLPDAFPWQVVTSGHLAATADLSEWSVVEVAPDRFQVQAPGLSHWFAVDDGSEERLSGVRQRAIADARDAFGDAILH